MILVLLSYVGIVSGVVASVLSIASGLYYLSEQVEEHTVVAKYILLRTIICVMIAHALLVVFDGLPIWRSLFSIFTNFSYLATLKQFPLVQVTSGSFIIACVCTFANHFVWFRYFDNDNIPPYSIKYQFPNFEGATHPPFSHIASFMGLMVWLLPILLFISLSASDNVLPTFTEDGKEKKKQRTGLAKQVLLAVSRHAGALLSKLGFNNENFDLS